MENIHLVPVGDWIDEYKQTVKNPISISGENVPSELSKEIRIYGTTPVEGGPGGKGIKKSCFESMEDDNGLLLFYHDSYIIATGRVKETFRSSEIGDWAWNSPKSSWVYTITDYKEMKIDATSIWNLLDFKEKFAPNGLRSVSDDALSSLLQKTDSNSVEKAIQKLKSGSETDTDN